MYHLRYFIFQYPETFLSPYDNSVFVFYCNVPSIPVRCNEACFKPDYFCALICKNNN